MDTTKKPEVAKSEKEIKPGEKIFFEALKINDKSELIDLLKKICPEQAKETDAEGIVCVDSFYQRLEEFTAETTIPDSRIDCCTFFVSRKIIVSWANEKRGKDGIYVTVVSEHYSRIDKFPGQNGKTAKIVRNFFVKPESLGKKIIATVNVTRKIDFYRNEEILCLDIVETTDQDHGKFPELCRINLNVEILDEASPSVKGRIKQFRIPGADNKAIRFTKLNCLSPANQAAEKKNQTTEKHEALRQNGADNIVPARKIAVKKRAANLIDMPMAN